MLSNGINSSRQTAEMVCLQAPWLGLRALRDCLLPEAGGLLFGFWLLLNLYLQASGSLSRPIYRSMSGRLGHSTRVSEMKRKLQDRRSKKKLFYFVGLNVLFLVIISIHVT